MCGVIGERKHMDFISQHTEESEKVEKNNTDHDEIFFFLFYTEVVIIEWTPVWHWYVLPLQLDERHNPVKLPGE